MKYPMTSLLLMTLVDSAAAQSGADRVAGIRLYPGSSRSNAEGSERLPMITRLCARVGWVAVAALVGCSGLPVKLPGPSAPGPDPQICGALRNTASTGALGHRPSQENAVRDMQRRGCPDIPKL